MTLVIVAGAIESFFVKYRFTAFPVLDRGRPIGLIDIATAERVPAGRRLLTTVREVAIAEPELIVDESQDVAELFERPAFQRTGRAVVLSDDGGVGIVSITDVRRVVRALELAGPAPVRPRPA